METSENPDPSPLRKLELSINAPLDSINSSLINSLKLRFRADRDYRGPRSTFEKDCEEKFTKQLIKGKLKYKKLYRNNFGTTSLQRQKYCWLVPHNHIWKQEFPDDYYVDIYKDDYRNYKFERRFLHFLFSAYPQFSTVIGYTFERSGMMRFLASARM